eukprot:12787210-Ditylum_brightwellii.AAC.1
MQGEDKINLGTASFIVTGQENHSKQVMDLPVRRFIPLTEDSPPIRSKSFSKSKKRILKRFSKGTTGKDAAATTASIPESDLLKYELASTAFLRVSVNISCLCTAQEMLERNSLSIDSHSVGSSIASTSERFMGSKTESKTETEEIPETITTEHTTEHEVKTLTEHGVKTFTMPNESVEVVTGEFSDLNVLMSLLSTKQEKDNDIHSSRIVHTGYDSVSELEDSIYISERSRTRTMKNSKYHTSSMCSVQEAEPIFPFGICGSLPLTENADENQADIPYTFSSMDECDDDDESEHDRTAYSERLRRHLTQRRTFNELESNYSRDELKCVKELDITLDTVIASDDSSCDGTNERSLNTNSYNGSEEDDRSIGDDTIDSLIAAKDTLERIANRVGVPVEDLIEHSMN